MIGMHTYTSDKIADRDKEKRNFSVSRVLSRICGTSYGAISTTPAGGVHIISFCIDILQ